MFRLESYVTPLIIGHVEKYVRNLRADKARVSLWGGDAVFSDLDLRLDVLEQELQLPLSIVSGHIHELIIHVPWTRLHAEPVLVTINTIECVLGLPTTSSASKSVATTASGATASSAAPRSASTSSLGRENRESSPPGYVQSLLNKIVANMSVVCNNLILKYVEDDIVLSLNTRHLRLTSANRQWQEAFVDIQPELILRKLLHVSDLTVCLDRREASGKIESYLEPVLYKCSFVVRAARCYDAIHAKKPVLTRLDVHCKGLEFALNDTQIPMFIRVFKLALGLYYGQIGPTPNPDSNKKSNEENNEGQLVVDANVSKEEESKLEGEDLGDESWSSLMWSVGSALGSSLVPVYWSDEDESDEEEALAKESIERVVHMGLYVDKASLVLKLTRREKASKKSMFGLAKQLFVPFARIDLQGIVMEALAKGLTFVNCTAGISQMLFRPVNDELTSENGAGPETTPYLSLGKPNHLEYLKNSLFDCDSDEEEVSKERRRDYSKLNWDTHLELSTEETMLARCPAVNCDYIFHMDMRDEYDQDILERSLSRCVVGPLKLSVVSGLIQRMHLLKQLSDQYDYPPYPATTATFVDHVKTNNEETSRRALSSRQYRLTLLNVNVKLHWADLSPIVVSPELKRFPVSTQNIDQLPGLALKVACFDVETTKPMFPSEVAGAEMRTLFQVAKLSSNLFVGGQAVTLMQPIDASVVHRVALNEESVIDGDAVKDDAIKSGSMKEDMLSLDNVLDLPQLRIRITRPQLEMALLIAKSHISEVSMKSAVIEDVFTRKLDALVLTWSEFKVRLAKTSSQCQIIELSLMKASAHLAVVDGGVQVPLLDDVDQVLVTNTSKLCSSTVVMSSPGRAHSRCRDASLRMRDLSPNREPLVYFLLQLPKPSSRSLAVLYCSVNPVFFNLDLLLVQWMTFYGDCTKESNVFMKTLRTRESRETSTFSDRRSVSNTRETTSIRSVISTSINEKKNVDTSKIAKNYNFMDKMRNHFELIQNCFIQIKVSSMECVMADKSLIDFSEATVSQTLIRARKKSDLCIVHLTTPVVIVESSNRKTNLTQFLHTLPFTLSGHESNNYGLPWTFRASRAALDVYVDKETSNVFETDEFACTVDISRKNDSDKMALCLHSDMKFLEINLSNNQLRAAIRVCENLADLIKKDEMEEHKEGSVANPKLGSVVSAEVVASSSVLIDRHVGDDDDDHNDNKPQVIIDNNDSNKVCNSVWMQWTSPGLRICLSLNNGSNEDDTKMEMSVEDLQWSLDWTEVYYRAKAKIASASVVLLQDDRRQLIFSSNDDIVEDLSLLQPSMTTMIASGPRSTRSESFVNMSWSSTWSLMKNEQYRRMDELDLEVGRMDTLIELRSTQLYIEHFIAPLTKSFLTNIKNSQSSSPSSSIVTTSPLMSIKQRGLRLFVQGSLPNSSSGHVISPDLILFFLDSIETQSSVTNPIPRLVLHPQLFHQGLNQGPESRLEDRQYSTQVKHIGLFTGQWGLLRTKNRDARSSKKDALMTTGENPAYEWNTKTRSTMTNSEDNISDKRLDEQLLQPLLSTVDIELLLAPPILTETTVVAAMSTELHLLNDIELYLSRPQLSLVKGLSNDLETIQSTLDHKESGKSRKKTSVSDSGVECSQNISRRNEMRVEEERKVPNEFVVTLRNITCHLFDISNDIEKDVRKGTESDNDAISSVKITPYLCLRLCQPHLYSRSSISNARQELVVFDAKIRFNEGKSFRSQGDRLPKTNDYNQRIFESRTGDLDERTGVQANLLKIVKYKSNENVKINVARPVKVTLDPRPIEKLLLLANRLRNELLPSNQVQSTQSNSEMETDDIISKVFNQSWKSLHLETSQFVVKSNVIVFDQENKKDNNGYSDGTEYDEEEDDNNVREAGFTAGLVSLRLSLSKTLSMNRDRSLILTTQAKNVVVKTHLESCADRLVNVVTLDSKLKITFTPGRRDQSLLAKIGSSPIKLRVGCNHILALKMIGDDLNRRFKPFLESHKNENLTEEKRKSRDEAKQNSSSVFMDDLRGGAFRFVVKEDSKECKPYQVLFSNNAMTWCYPSPRALIRLSVSPVPIQTNLDKFGPRKSGRLEFWDELEERFMSYGNLYVSEQTHCHLNLPTVSDKRKCAVATIWRIVIIDEEDNDEEDNDNNSKDDVDVRALGTAVRVDSCQDESLVPNLRISLNLACIQLNLVNHLQSVVMTLPESHSHFYLSPGQFPLEQNAVSLQLTNIQSIVESWSARTLLLRTKAGFYVDVDETQFLTSHSLLEVSSLQIQSRYECLPESKHLDTFVQMDEMSFHYGQFAHRTLTSTANLWQNQLLNTSIDDYLFSPPVFAHYLVSNDTQLSLWFGQQNTSENILLRPRQCFMYAWRSQHAPLLLRLKFDPLPASEQPKWSVPFGVQDNFEIVRYIEDPILGQRAVVITAKVVDNNRFITISGLLSVVSLLRDALEVRLFSGNDRNEDIHEPKDENERWLLPGMSLAPSSLIKSKDQTLKVRLHGIGTQWSGHIPLLTKKRSKSSVLVRIPTKDRGQVLTVWCRSIAKTLKNDLNQDQLVRIVLVFSPMYVAKSSLPQSMTMLYTADDDDDMRRRSTLLPGRDVVTQLDTFCMSDKKYNVAFQVSDVASEAIDMHYRLMERHENFVEDADDAKIDIDHLQIELGALIRNENLDKSWPYVDVINLEKEARNEQPKTEVYVSYKPLCRWTNTLCVEIKPWCLIVNDLKTDIGLKIGVETLFTLKSGSTFVPPKFDANFRIGLFNGSNEGNNFFYSDVLQLSEKINWPFRRQTMPSFQGQLMKEGYSHTKIIMDSSICFITVHSTMNNRTRVLHIKPTFVVLNRSGIDVSIKAFIAESNFDDNNNEDTNLIVSSGNNTALLDWSFSKKEEGLDERSTFDQTLIFSEGLERKEKKKSKPINFEDLRRESDDDQVVTRPFTLPKALSKSENELNNVPMIMTAHNTGGQVYFVLNDDLNPRLIVHNGTDMELKVAKYECLLSSTSSILPHSSSSVAVKIDTNNSQEERPLLLCLSAKGSNNWSERLDCSVDQERFISLKGKDTKEIDQSVKVSVKRMNCTTHLYIEAGVNLQQVSPGAIRNRLIEPKDDISDNDFKNKRNEDEHNIDLIKQKSTKNDEAKSLKCVFQLHINELSLVLMDDCIGSHTERQEQLRLTLDGFLVDIRPLLTSEDGQMQLRACLTDLQLDNSMFDREPFDFRTILFSTNGATFVKTAAMMSDQALNEAMDQALFKLTLSLEKNLSVTKLAVEVRPLMANVEDRLINSLRQILATFKTNTNSSSSKETPMIPMSVVATSQMLCSNLSLEELHIAPIHVSLSVHTSLKLYLGVEDSPLIFSAFHRRRLATTNFGLGQSLAMHYISGALFRAGMMVASIDLIGNPALLTRSISTGLVDFVTKPLQGLLNGPWAFVEGLSFGSRSLITHLGGGTLSSITNMADSLSRNLDKMSLDEEHCARNALIRSHERPRGLTDGLRNGLSSVGLGLLGAVGGLAHHPLAVFMEEEQTLAGGVAKGMVGVVTKPLGAAAELVAQTGQGILAGVGWRREVQPRHQAAIINVKSFVEGSGNNRARAKIVEYSEQVILALEAALKETNQSVLLVLTEDHLVILDLEQDYFDILQSFPVSNETELKPKQEDNNKDDSGVVLILTHYADGRRRRLRHEHVARFVYGHVTDHVTDQLSEFSLARDEDKNSEGSIEDANETKRRNSRRKSATRIMLQMSNDAAMELLANFELATRQTHNKGFLLM